MIFDKKKGKFSPQIHLKVLNYSKIVYLGYYDSIEEAEEAKKKATDCLKQERVSLNKQLRQHKLNWFYEAENSLKVVQRSLGIRPRIENALETRIRCRNKLLQEVE